jgi:hypothetical protein
MSQRPFLQHILKNGQRMCITSQLENLQYDNLRDRWEGHIKIDLKRTRVWEGEMNSTGSSDGYLWTQQQTSGFRKW